MLDLKVIRENPDKIKKSIEDRKSSVDIDGFLELDRQRRAIIQSVDELKARRNKASEAIGEAKKTGKEMPEAIAEMKKVSGEIKNMDTSLRDIEKQNHLLKVYSRLRIDMSSKSMIIRANRFSIFNTARSLLKAFCFS